MVQGVVDRCGESVGDERRGIPRDLRVDQTHELRLLCDFRCRRSNAVEDVFVDTHHRTSTVVSGMRRTPGTGDSASPNQRVSRRPTVSPMYPAMIVPRRTAPNSVTRTLALTRPMTCAGAIAWRRLT